MNILLGIAWKVFLFFPRLKALDWNLFVFMYVLCGINYQQILLKQKIFQLLKLLFPTCKKLWFLYFSISTVFIYMLLAFALSTLVSYSVWHFSMYSEIPSIHPSVRLSTYLSTYLLEKHESDGCFFIYTMSIEIHSKIIHVFGSRRHILILRPTILSNKKGHNCWDVDVTEGKLSPLLCNDYFSLRVMVIILFYHDIFIAILVYT